MSARCNEIIISKVKLLNKQSSVAVIKYSRLWLLRNVTNSQMWRLCENEPAKFFRNPKIEIIIGLPYRGVFTS